MDWRRLLSTYRLGSDHPGEVSPDRSPFQQDFDRIVFSGAFRRLQDKTQVFPLVRSDYVRTRLTHSLETSSIGRSLGRAAGAFICKEYSDCGITPADIGSIVAAACLAHDIGNPPLGHAGEEAIRYWFTSNPIGQAMAQKMSAEEVEDFANYEGNAQGFRVLSRLEMPDRRGGMRLTCATLGAFAKYPCGSAAGCRPPGVAGKKFNFFCADFDNFSEMAERTGMIRYSERGWRRHPLAYLVEAADDIAYRVVDFEDGDRRGLIPHALLEEKFLRIIDSSEIADRMQSVRSNLHRAEFLRAKVIGCLLDECVEVFKEHQSELLSGQLEKPLIDYIVHRDVLAEIREISEREIYNHRGVVEVVSAGFEMVSGMLDIFVPCANEMAIESTGGAPASLRSRRLSALIPGLDQYLADPQWCANGALRLMSIVDYISSMTDSYAVGLFQKLRGISL